MSVLNLPPPPKYAWSLQSGTVISIFFTDALKAYRLRHVHATCAVRIFLDLFIVIIQGVS